jgi:hypothetical protein
MLVKIIYRSPNQYPFKLTKVQFIFNECNNVDFYPHEETTHVTFKLTNDMSYNKQQF